MARALLPMFVCVFVSAGVAQGTPEAALAELALAKDYKSAAKHYPTAIVDALGDLPAQDQAVAKNELLPIYNLYGTQVTPKASEDGTNLLVLDTPDAKRKFLLRVKRRVSDGVTAMLELESCEEDVCFGDWRAWMKLEEGEWRLDELQEGYVNTLVNLADPDLVERLKHAEIHHNEERATQTIYQVRNAVNLYATIFKDAGFPEKLSMMLEAPAKPGDEKKPEAEDQQETPPNPEHAGFLGENFGKDPCEIDGYRFEYTLLRHGQESTGAFSITATAVEFGKTGTKSFYLDESGVMRTTKEDRMATATDSAVKGSAMPGVTYVQ